MSWLWPVSSRRITQGPHAGHTAFDIGVPRGTPVVAPTDAVVSQVVANDRRGYGNLVVLRTADGRQIYLAHLAGFAARPGQRVARGQVVGYSGSSGHSTGPHLHLEIRGPDNRPINPMGFFFSGGAPASLPQPRPVMTIPQQPRRQSLSKPARAAAGSLPRVSVSPVTRTARTPQTAGQAGSIPLISTPAGPIGLAGNVAWRALLWNSGTLLLGALVLLIGVSGLVSRTEAGSQGLKMARELAPEALGLVNPGLGLAANVISHGSQVARRAVGRERRRRAYQKPVQHKEE